MLAAVLADFVAEPDVDCVTLLHPAQVRLHQSGVQVLDCVDAVEAINQIAPRVDACLIIAPEMDGVLSRLTTNVIDVGGRLLGCGPTAIDIFGDKLRTAQVLGRLCVETTCVPSLPDSELIVVKPRDGVGALHTAVCARDAIHIVVDEIERRGYHGQLVAQPWLVGRSASVACLMNSDCTIILPAVEQLLERSRLPLSSECTVTWLSYAGGRLPLSPALNARAARLAENVVTAGLDLYGYVGIDLVLGDDEDGRDDRVLEVNPRLTTSYVGYRALMPRQLAPMLLGRIPGTRTAIDRVPIVDVHGRSLFPEIRFQPDGTTNRESLD